MALVQAVNDVLEAIEVRRPGGDGDLPGRDRADLASTSRHRCLEQCVDVVPRIDVLEVSTDFLAAGALFRPRRRTAAGEGRVGDRSRERNSVGRGKWVSVRVDLGGLRILK